MHAVYKKKVTYDLKEFFLWVNVTDKKRCLENSLQINYRKLFFFECCAGISMSRQKKDKISFLRFGLKKLRGVINQALKKKVCVFLYSFCLFWSLH